VGRIRGEVVMRFGLLFPGQGSQSTGMGRELHDAVPEARAVFEEADAALEESLSRLCFEGPDENLARTENTQPAILTVSIAALRALEAAGLTPAAAAAGHSLGEYSAHVAAGTLTFSDAVRCVRARGRFMQDAVPVGVGAMAALIGLEPPEVEALCADAAQGQVVSSANLNSPGQIVIAGHAEAVERARALAVERGARKAVPLPVSAPFHCALMGPAAERLAPVLESLAWTNPNVPVYANVDAVAVSEAAEARRRLVEQVASPVRWIQVIEAMLGDGIRTFLEVGPGRVLSGLVRRIDRGATVHAVSDPASVDAAVAAMRPTGEAS
jgi:[acyl-carrier-protein] S-malonyltransferase